jgi:hypothetical protein
MVLYELIKNCLYLAIEGEANRGTSILVSRKGMTVMESIIQAGTWLIVIALFAGTAVAVFKMLAGAGR